MAKKKAYIVEFFQFFMKNILPYEVKYSTIKKVKSYDLHREVMNELLFNFNDELNDKTFYEILTRLEYIAFKVQTNYFNELTTLFKDKVVLDSLKKSINCIECNEPNYIEAIRILEQDLQITENSNESPVEKLFAHISDSIYDSEYSKLKVVLTDFKEAFNYLNEDINSPSLQNADEPKCKNCNATIDGIVTKEEYLQYVVFNETWNFLSHMAYAMSNFGTPSVYINNIDKGTSHLRRAILDIYDGLILEKQKVDEDYLSIRAVKLNSLGSHKKIIDLSSQLKEYYVKNRGK